MPEDERTPLTLKMPRRKAKVYHRSTRPQSTIDCRSPKGRLLRSLSKQAVLRLSSYQSSIATGQARFLRKSASNRVVKAEKVRKRLQVLLGFNAFLCISATLLGYFIVNEENRGLTTWKVTLCAGLTLISLLQLPGIVFYWSQSLRYTEICRNAYHLSPTSTKSVLSSRIHILLCVLECSFHLLTLIPAGNICFPLPASPVSICLNDLLYWLIALRCYVLVRLFYWTSSLSQGRTELYAKLTSSKYGLSFIIRACISDYKYGIVLVAYGVMAALPALLKYLVERHSLDGHSLWDQIWLFAYSEATIGYGDFPASVWLSRLLLLLSSFAGLCAMGFLSSVSSHDLCLTRAQSNLCAELLVRKVRIQQLLPVTFLLQSWWRLMRMRKMRLINGPVILSFYGRLGKFRKLLTQRERVKHGFFDHQIDAFDSAIRNRIQKLSEYLRPINSTAVLVLPIQMSDFVRFQAQIYRMTLDFKRLKGVNRRKIELSSGFEGSEAGESGNSPKSFATVKRKAFQHLKGRLLH